MKHSHSRTVGFFLLFSLLLALAGCWESSGLDRLEDLYPSAGDSDAADGDLDAPEAEMEFEAVQAETLAGRWAMLMTLNSTINPVIDPWPMLLENLFLVDIPEDQSEMRLVACQQFADVDGIGDLGVIEYSDETIQKISETPLTIPLACDADSPERCTEPVMPQKVLWHWGLHVEDMDDPENDRLPEKKDDPLVWDQDEDGHAGVTVHVLSPLGYRYMVRRAIWNLGKGTLSEDRMWITGSMTFRVDQKSVDADRTLLLTDAPITAIDEGNVYQMRLLETKDQPIDGDLDFETDAESETADGDLDAEPDDVSDGDADAEAEAEAEPEAEPESEAAGRTFKEGEAVDYKYTCERLIREYKQLFDNAPLPAEEK